MRNVYNEIISCNFPVSAQLGLFAVLFAVFGGMITGIISALKQGKWQDNAAMVIATLGVTIPSFVLATLFIYVFGLKLRLLPPMGWGKFKHVILPGIALGGYSMAFIARLVRSSLLDVVRQDFIRTARAKGRLKPIPGTPPDLLKPPAGCPFAPRCEYAKVCLKEKPPFFEVSDGHKAACWLLHEAAPDVKNLVGKETKQ